jgi:hypothetical protein
LFFIFASIVFGLIGGKRAIFIFVPILIIFLGLFLKHNLKNIVIYSSLGIIIILLTGYLSIKYLPTLNPQREYGGTVDFKYLKDFLIDYNLDVVDGASAGRIATTINVFNILRLRGLKNLLFGLSPGSYIETRFASLKTTLKEKGDLSIIYGTTGLSWLALQSGYLGAVTYLILFCLILNISLQYWKKEKRSYWKAFAFGNVGFSFVMVLISLTYWAVFIDDLIPCIFFLVSAFVIKVDKNFITETSSQFNSKIFTPNY